MRIKICGITTLEDALECCRLGADALGFVFFKKSRRYISEKRAASIIKQLPPFISTVGVFVDEQPGIVNEKAETAGLDYIQLHGTESPEYIKKMKKKTIKAFRIKKEFNFSLLNEYNCSYILLDSYDETEPGGTGKKFDWSLIPEEVRNRIILSGGISEKNVEEIIKDISPRGIDLSSSVESSPGTKDKVKLKRFFKIIEEVK